MIYEYIRILYDGSLEELCSLAFNGWRLHSSVNIEGKIHFILERPILIHDVEEVRGLYRNSK